jgi:hypothetical protein
MPLVKRTRFYRTTKTPPLRGSSPPREQRRKLSALTRAITGTDMRPQPSSVIMLVSNWYESRTLDGRLFADSVQAGGRFGIR